MPSLQNHLCTRTLIRVTLKALLLSSLGLLKNASAQTDQNLEIGLTPYKSYDGGNIDSVSLLNGNLNLHIPLFSYPQRGSLTEDWIIVYNDKPWFVQQICENKTSPCTLNWRLAVWKAGGVAISTAAGAGATYAPLVPGQSGSPYIFTAHTADGGSHLMMSVNSGGYETVDGTGIWYNGGIAPPAGTGTYIAKTRDGVTYNTTTPAGPFEDSNGNELDTLARSGPSLPGSTTTDYTGCVAPASGAQISSATIATFPGQNGSTRNVKICSASYSVSFSSGKNPMVDQNGFSDPINPGSATTTFVVSIVPYNGTSWPTSPAWGFDYTGGGNLSKIAFPTGGSVTYTWAGAQACYDPLPGLVPTSLGVSTRTINAQDGLGPLTTSYGYGTNAHMGSNNLIQQTTTVTDPSGNETDHIFSDLVYQTCSLYETQTNYYQGSQAAGTLLKTLNTDYIWTANPFGGNMNPPTAINVLPIRKTTVWPNGQTYKVETDRDANFKSNSYSFSYGDVTAVREYDYTGALVRTTTTNYLAFSNSAYLSANLLDLVTSSVVTDGTGSQMAKATYAYDGSTLQSSGITTQRDTTVPNPGTRGNRTSACRWLNTTGANLCTTTAFYDTGMPYQVTDPNGNQTTYAYSSAYDGAYVTQTTMPNTGSPVAHHVVSGTYDFNTGEVLSVTDQNGKVSNYSYDAFGRILSATFPDNGATTLTYTDSPLASTVERVQTIASGVNNDYVVSFDGLGRAKQTELKSDPDGPAFTATTYDALGRTASTYSPTRCTTPTTNCGESTWGLATTQYDALGRGTLAIPPDGTPTTNNIKTVYSGNCTTVTDQAGKSRKSCTDALGRLTQVFEDPAGLNYETDYTYDALNNLLTVNQKGGSANSSNWRTRTFTYDSLSRLTQATNPESGTINYSYDANGNLLQKTSPAPNQTGSATVTLSYCYDALNRVTGKAYTAQTCSSGLLPTPLVSYFYDQSSYNGLTITNGIGRRTGMSDQAGVEAWSYDVMGRALSDLRSTNSLSKTFTYSYNLDGSLKMLGYPTGANNTYPEVVTYQPGGAGRPINLLSNGAYFVGDAHYTPAGANCYLQDYWDGTWTSVGTFNNRQQPKTYQVVQQFSGTPPSVCTAMNAVAGIMDFSYNFLDSSSHNNGNVQTIYNNIDWHRTQSFTYDSLNRISTAQTNATNKPAFQGDNSLAMCWAETFTYDGWGNLVTLGPNSTTQPNYVGCTQESGFNYTGAIGINNRIAETGFTYDAPGNMTVSPAFTYVYDAENHLTQIAGVTYSYDGDGKRVMKSNGTIYWYGTGSDPILETDLSANLKYQYFYFGGQRVGREDGSNSVTWYFGDHLGSSRVVWSTAGNDNSDFYPFGGERVISSGTANTYKFTSKERDAESGLDNFGARYNSSTMGRWMSPDTVNLTDARVQNPTNTVNKYVYGGNNPLKYVDPDGRDIIFFYASPGTGPEGHFFAVAWDNTTGASAVLDFGPKNDGAGQKIAEALGIPVEGSNDYSSHISSPDDLRDNFSSFTVQTNPGETQEAIQVINQFNGSNHDYATFSTNCTTVCRDLANKVLKLNSSAVQPSRLWSDVFNAYGLRKGQLPYFRTPPPSSPGKDYGNPRPGINPSDLVWLLLHQRACVTTLVPDGKGGSKPETTCY